MADTHQWPAMDGTAFAGGSGLRRLREARAVRARFAAVDALVAFVPDALPIPDEVKEHILGKPKTRWAPAKGGRSIRAPFAGDEVPAGPFTLEPGGWDHENCRVCGDKIMAGAECWASTLGASSYYCDACHERAEQMEPPAPAPAPRRATPGPTAKVTHISPTKPGGTEA